MDKETFIIYLQAILGMAIFSIALIVSITKDNSIYTQTISATVGTIVAIFLVKHFLRNEK